MKKIALLLFTIVCMYSCSSGPEKTARSFVENVSKGKIDEAKKYSTESTGKLLDLAASFGGNDVNPDFKFIFVKDSIDGNRAWVTFKNEKDQENILTLVKIDGDWKVNMDTNK